MKVRQWRSQPNNLGVPNILTLSEQQHVVRDTASRST